MKCKYSLLIKVTRQSLTERVNNLTTTEEELQQEVLYLRFKDREMRNGRRGMDSEEGNTSYLYKYMVRTSNERNL